MPSSIRISDELAEKAEEVSATSLRTTTKQIEYWAVLGQELEPLLSPIDIQALLSHDAELKVVRKDSKPVDMDVVLQRLEGDRLTGKLHTQVVHSDVWYEASVSHPGFLDRVNKNGSRETGTFNDGKFTVKFK